MDAKLSTAYEAAAKAVPLLRAQAARTDELARFPVEAIAELRTNGLMGLLVPVEYGGIGGDLGDLVAVAGKLAAACTSTALIWAMHCQQVDCVVRFGSQPLRDMLLRRIAAGEVYLASVTTEPGKGGHLLTGGEALVDDQGRLVFERTAPVVTGGDHADGFLITMRESPDAPDHRVTLFYAARDQLDCASASTWDALGMRGTASGGLRIRGSAPHQQIIGKPGDFRTVAIECMIPAGHLGLSSVWLGAARGALSDLLGVLRTRGSGTLPDLTAERLARCRMDVELVGAYLAAVRDEVLSHRRSGTSVNSAATQIHLNNLKVTASELTFRAANTMIEIAGMFAGYQRNPEMPLERVFRDLRSASLNYSNNRLTTMNGALTLLDRDVTLAPGGVL